MRIRAQIGMVLNLDKCIGCHTCSVTCKNVWTSRDGVEYAWFNNVETKPGIGYPKEWENQGKWKGGWNRTASGKLEPRQGGKLRILANLFANPNLPQIDDYYEPYTYDYEHLKNAPLSQTPPTARPVSVLTGKKMDKIHWGPNWEDDLGGEFSSAQPRPAVRGRAEGDVLDLREHLHDVPAAPVRALPEPGLCRQLPVRLYLQARGRRHRAGGSGQVPGLAHVHLRLPVQEDLLQLAERQGREVHLLLSAHRGRPADRVLRDLRGPDPLPGRDAVRRRPDRARRRRGQRAGPVPVAAGPVPGSALARGDRRRARAGHSRVLAGGRPQVAGLQDGRAMARGLPAALRNTARCPWSGTSRRCRRSRRPPSPARCRPAPWARAP